MFSSLGNFSQQSSASQFTTPGLTNAYKPYGYSSEPARSPSNISIDDIIGALQNARADTAKMEAHVASMKESQPKPIDLGKGNTVYIVAHKTFASGNVWHPDTPLLPNDKVAKFELQRLRRIHPETEYALSKLEWTVIQDAPVGKGFHWDVDNDNGDYSGDSGEDEDVSLNKPSVSEGENNNGEEKRYVFCPKPSRNNIAKEETSQSTTSNRNLDQYGFPESF